MTTNSDSTGSLRLIKPPLDYEDERHRFGFNLTVAVSDSGDIFSDPGHVDYARVLIKLRDLNDNSPVFAKSNVTVTIPEDGKVGSIVTKMHATDPDAGGFSRVSYELDSRTNKQQFSVDRSGFIRLEKPLDREHAAGYQLIVIARDDGVPLSRSATATVNVIVDDVNDNAPVITGQLKPVVMENSIPQKIVEIYATDADDRTKGKDSKFCNSFIN